MQWKPDGRIEGGQIVGMAFLSLIVVCHGDYVTPVLEIRQSIGGNARNVTHRFTRAMRCTVVGLTPNRSAESIWTEAIMTGEQPGKIGLWRELQLLWPILLRWREYRVGDYMRAVQQELHREQLDDVRTASGACEFCGGYDHYDRDAL